MNPSPQVLLYLPPRPPLALTRSVTQRFISFKGEGTTFTSWQNAHFCDGSKSSLYEVHLLLFLPQLCMAAHGIADL